MSPATTEAAARARAVEALAEFDRQWASTPGAPRLRSLFAGRDADYQRLVARVERATGTTLPVLIEGPSGTGAPALVALTIHQTGAQRSGPLIRVRGHLPPADWRPSVDAAAQGSLLVSEADALAPKAQEQVLALLDSDLDGGPRVLVCAGGALSAPLAARLAVLRIAVGERPSLEAATPTPERLGTLEAVERATIAERLRAFDWQQQRTAASLGIDRKTLYRKIKRYGLEQPPPPERA